MKWYYFILGGLALIGVGYMIRKKELDGAANARAARGVKQNSDGQADTDTAGV